MKQAYVSPKALVINELPQSFCLDINILSNLENGFGFGQLDDDTLNEE